MKTIFASIILISIILFNPTFSQKLSKLQKTTNLNKTNVVEHYSIFNINNISTFIYNNGNADLDPTGNSGFIFPKGTNKPAVFESGVVWGGKKEGKILVGGSTYSQGLLGGKILNDGTPQDPSDESARVYRVRPDFNSNLLIAEFEDETKSFEEIKNQYEKDWNEWPANDGAPFEDVDKNGVYNPAIDIPGVPGAAQTLWYVANDFNEETVISMYGSTPMKVEVQVTIWGYNHNGIYDDVMFKKYKLINKNSKDIDSMYFTIWADTDLGYAGDDNVGCDTLLNLGYCYNGKDDDEVYGTEIPAVGFQILQGPIVNGLPGEFAIKDNQKIYGKKNVGMTSFFFFLCGEEFYIDPDLGTYNGTLEFYNIMQGLFPRTGTPFVDPVTGLKTKFTLAGDPITKQGWVDGLNTSSCGDRRFVTSSGPFELKADSVQEIVFAEFAAPGKDRLNSVTLLKNYAEKLQQDYPNIIITPTVPNVSQLEPALEPKESTSSEVIEMNILSNPEIENFSEDGFTFQGYNIYQIAYDPSHKTSGKRIFTFDVVDNITNITGERYDPITGELVTGVIFEGTNSGIPEYVIVDKDYQYNSNLLKGKTYYHGISAYFYNETEQKFAETGVYTIGKTFKENESGFNYLDSIKAFQIIGRAELKSTIEIIDPAKITGDTYEVTFGEQDYFLDSDGKWKSTNWQDSVGNSLSKTGDLTGSKLIPLPTTYAPNNTYNIHFVLDLRAVDFDYSDGVRITFPNNIVINSASHVVGNAYSVTIPAVINGQTVTWGNNDTTGDGEFLGGEDFAVNINASGVELNFSVDYEIYDDGWANVYAVGGEIVHASGTATLTGEVGYDIRAVNYWKLFNKTKQEDLLNYQTVISGKDLLTNEPAPYGYEPIVDGFRIKLDGTFDASINFQNVELTQDPNGRNNLSTYGSAGTTQIDISNYTIFPGIVSSWAFDNFGVGTTDKAQLSQDYALRFTGVLDTNVVNGQTQISVKSGGSMATCFRFTEGLIYHPLNTTGKDEAFLLRIPFEVWNVEDPSSPFQVNLTFRDRLQQSTSEIFYSWNLVNRMYGIIVNSPYNPNQPIQVDNGPDEFNSLATWVLVFYETNYDVGQVVKVTYANPILLTDKLTFTTDYLSDVSNSDILPNKYELYQNYPNPFNPSTKIGYSIQKEGIVNITVYNILGQKVREVINQFVKPGKYEATFNGANLASGVYIYRIKTNDFVESKKMMLLK